MNLLSECFQQLSFKKEKKAPKSKRQSENFSYTNKSSKMETEPSLQQLPTTSNEGKDFKYNEAGRRYHGNDEVAYSMPNDDDGKNEST